MAQTKRKRQTKHRGNAAGMIEARGRTGRKPTPEERKKEARGGAAAPRGAHEQAADVARRRPAAPRWRGHLRHRARSSSSRSRAGRGAALTGFMLLLYIPMGYYTDLLLYRRRQAKKPASKAKPLMDVRMFTVGPVQENCFLFRRDGSDRR